MIMVEKQYSFKAKKPDDEILMEVLESIPQNIRGLAIKKILKEWIFSQPVKDLIYSLETNFFARKNKLKRLLELLEIESGNNNRHLKQEYPNENQNPKPNSSSNCNVSERKDDEINEMLKSFGIDDLN